MRLSVIGLGKLGAPIAAVLAHKGHTVIGMDVNSARVNAINEGRAPVNEPGLEEMVRDNRSHLSATLNCAKAVAATEVTFIIVPTPSGPDGTFSLQYVLDAARLVGSALRDKRDFHLIALSSTVGPGSTAGVLLPALENSSGKRCGRGFGLCYNPQLIALGTAIRNMLNPDLVLIGESDKHSGDILEKLYHRVCESDPMIARMSFVNAELTKLAVNSFVTTKISYANLLAQLCEKLPGADVDVVTSAMGADSRIGRRYFKGALGYGGPCFPRDNIAFSAICRNHGVAADLAEATDELNRRQVPRLAEMILARLPENGTVGVLGLSYKPETNLIEESQGFALVRHLLSKGVRVVAYDPAAMENARAQLAGNVVFASSVRHCLGEAHVVAITTPWDEFRSISPADLNCSNGVPTVFDCWRLLSREDFEPAVNYLTVGMGPEGTAAEETAAGIASAKVQGG